MTVGLMREGNVATEQGNGAVGVLAIGAQGSGDPMTPGTTQQTRDHSIHLAHVGSNGRAPPRDR